MPPAELQDSVPAEEFQAHDYGANGMQPARSVYHSFVWLTALPLETGGSTAAAASLRRKRSDFNRFRRPDAFGSGTTPMS
jgi:hypothetical protein